MSDTKHTPTPWMAVNHSWSTIGIYAKDHAKGGVIAVLCIEGEATEDTQAELEEWMGANAAFIVRAVNSHEQLVAALQNCIDFINDAHIVEAQWAWEPIETARAALAAAEAA